MTKNETIGFTLNEELLKEIDRFIPECYTSRKEFMRSAVRAYIETEGERLFSGKPKTEYVKLDAEYMAKLDALCNEFGRDTQEMLDIVLESYITMRQSHINLMKYREDRDYDDFLSRDNNQQISDAFACLDKLL
jgi:predicted transcriptional regulator